MWIDVDNVVARVSKISDEEANWLFNFLVLPVNGFRARYLGGSQGEPLYNVRAQCFPSGLLYVVQRGARAEGIEVNVRDKRQQPGKHDHKADLSWLRDYQHEAVERCFRKHRGIIKVGTGGGKTEIIAALAALYPVEWDFLVHRASLLDEIATRIERRIGEPVGRFGDGRRTFERVNVVMFQSLHKALCQRDSKALAHVKRIQGMGIDEVHVAASKTFLQTAQAYSGAYYRFGFSGTPLDRSDERNLAVIGATGDVIYRLDSAELVEHGAIARPTIHLVRVPVPKIGGYKPTTMVQFSRQWSQAYDAVMASRARMDALVTTVKQAPKPCLVFVKSIDHGREVTRALRGNGVTADFVFGQRDTGSRASAVKALQHGDLDVLVANIVFQEGVDIPHLQSLVMAGANKSTIGTLQSLGRALRRTDSSNQVVKDEVPVFDIADTHCGCKRSENGYTLYDHNTCKWFDQHTVTRVKDYRKAGHTVVDS